MENIFFGIESIHRLGCQIDDQTIFKIKMNPFKYASIVYLEMDMSSTSSLSLSMWLAEFWQSSCPKYDALLHG